MEITCINCTASITVIDNFKFNYFSCPVCNSNYKFKEEELIFLDKTSIASLQPKLKIGSKGVFDTITYTVIHFVYKINQKKESWCEYLLLSENDEVLYLIEEKGHWSIEKRISLNQKINSESILYNGIQYKKYETGRAKEVYRVGFFEDKIDVEYNYYEDFIAPPYGISFENEDKQKHYYFAEYLSQEELKKIFAIDNLPSREGIGALQPFYYNLSQVYTVFIVGILLVTLLHIIFYTQSKENLVYENLIDLDQANSKTIFTAPFDLKGPIAPLGITVQSDVDNSWMTTDFALINLETNETAYFSKDLEYYYGYSEGENWTEGSKKEEFNICGVSAGKYKIMILPNKEENSANSSLRIRIYWGKPDNWNLYVSIAIFLAIGVILYFIKNNFESKRWEDNYYSLYKKDK
ncbi:conserved hypothetical protein [Flavobacterium sp. 9AF]|uniref:DUF4178 domain-containing protein n=1 Tax=Flavobacterium sp. 9AF TaxID=2653142 RepID=UPI0012EF50D0|nr:DUF4178 domain-containing protein [Flavobacterium sp. 9AF]VXC02524.1 conserved hypothetical protein [Flavobacterium sp. 9AF]